MKKFIYIYYAGPQTDAGDNQAWGQWFGQLGEHLVDGGNPFNQGGQAVHQGGVMDIQGPPATGYSIVSADSLDAAIKLTEGCPLLGSKDAAVCVYEALPM